MAQEQARTSRVEARLTPDTLAMVKRAAELQGRSVSDFMVAAARDAANRVIAEAQIIRLSVEDQKAFADSILDPPAPTAALLRAARNQRQLIRGGF